LNIAPYSGFLNPVYETVTNDLGEIVDIKLDFQKDILSRCKGIPKIIRYCNLLFSWSLEKKMN
jgi:hypothetical protein